MNWETLHRLPTPAECEPGATRPERRVHVRVAGDTFSLCHAADVLDGRWVPRDDHPEDTDSDARCSVCWSVFEKRRREENGREAVPSNYLGRRRSSFTFSDLDFAR